jgi:hypothetical protein
MDAFRAGPDAPMTGTMVAFIVMTGALIAVASLLRESPVIRGTGSPGPGEGAG